MNYDIKTSQYGIANILYSKPNYCNVTKNLNKKIKHRGPL